MEPTAKTEQPENVSVLQIRTVFTDRNFLESIGRGFETEGKITGFVIREVVLSHGSGFELVFCVPAKSIDLAKELAAECGRHIKERWHTPATFIEPAISPVTVNSELGQYLNGRNELPSFRKWGLGAASLAGLTLVGFCGLRKSETEELAAKLNHPSSSVWVLDPHDPSQTLHVLPDIDGSIFSDPAFKVVPTDMAALPCLEEAGSSADIARFYRDYVKKLSNK